MGRFKGDNGVLRLLKKLDLGKNIYSELTGINLAMHGFPKESAILTFNKIN